MAEERATMDVSLASGASESDVPAGYKRADAGVIPEDWCTSSVGAEFTVQLGKMLDRAKNIGTPKPYIGNRSVQWGRIGLQDIATMPMTPSDVRRFRLKRGDLLVCEGGEVGRAAIWNDPIPECYYQKALHRLRPKGSYVVPLMMAQLQLWASTGRMTNHVTQTSIAHLPKDKLELMPLPVPPVQEQRAIAEVLSDVDGLIESLEALIAKKRVVKTAAMQQLLTGRTRLPGFGDEWERKRFGDLCTFLSTANNPRADLEGHGEVGYIHYGNVHAHPLPVLDCGYHELPRIEERRIGNASRLQDGDLVMVDASEDLAGLGKSVEVLGIGDDGIVAGLHTILCRDRSDHWAPGFKSYLQFIPAFRSALARIATGISVYAISRKQLADIVLALPSPSEQAAIVAVLSDMGTEIVALESRLDKVRALKQGMMQQLLTGRIRLPAADAADGSPSMEQNVSAHRRPAVRT